MYGTPTSAAATSAQDGPHWRLRSCEIRREQGEIRREKGATASTSTAGKAAADDGGGADVAAAAAVLTSSLSDHEAMEAVFELEEEEQEQEREQGQSSPDSEEKDGEEVAALYAELQEALQQGQEEAVARANRHSWCEERQAFYPQPFCYDKTDCMKPRHRLETNAGNAQERPVFFQGGVGARRTVRSHGSHGAIRRGSAGGGGRPGGAAAPCVPAWMGLCGAENTSFVEFSLLLSRACLGKMIVFLYKWLKKPFSAGVYDVVDRGVCGQAIAA